MEEIQLPAYARITLILLGFVLVAAVLYLAGEILIPIAFAAFFAIFLDPFSEFLRRRGLPQFLAIVTAVVLCGLVLGGAATFIGLQIGSLSEELPAIEDRIAGYFAGLQVFVRKEFGIASHDQLTWLKQWAASALQGEEGLLNRTFRTFADVLTFAILVPIYTFLFLFYKKLIVDFFLRILKPTGSSLGQGDLSEVRCIVQNYVVGRLLETAIFAVLSSIAFLSLGISYPFLFGVIAAIVNLIPYIGGLAGGILPLLVALGTKDSIWYSVGVIGVLVVIQLLDSYVLIPAVVGSRVQVNALASIVAVVAGGYLWGIPGMLLSQPLIAILKVFCDRVESLKPWGALLGAKAVNRTGKPNRMDALADLAPSAELYSNLHEK